MRIGFTGTGQGATLHQKQQIEHHLKLLGATELHHGDCIGADASAHYIATKLNIKTVQHPPTLPYARAFTICDDVRPQKHYIERNHHIVNECEHLIACPQGTTEVLRSGTWATIRYARKVGKPVTIIWPEER